MPTITRSYHFCAAHRYWNKSWDNNKNESEFGKDIYVHGHNYNIEVSITGPVNENNGFIINLKDIDNIMEPLIEKLDHCQIEKDIKWFDGKQPSSENLSIFIWESIVNNINKPAQLENVRIYETQRIFTDYSGAESDQK